MRRLDMHFVIAIIHNSVTTVFATPENVPTGSNLTIEVNIYFQLRTYVDELLIETRVFSIGPDSHPPKAGNENRPTS